MAHAPDDELLSSMLDGEPAPGDTAHIAGCDECQARLGQLRAAATALATPVTLPLVHVREAAVREALLVADDASSRTGRVLPFRRRSSSAPRQRRRNPLSAAAALLVAVLVGGWALSMIGRDNGNRIDETTLAAPAATESANALGLAKDNAAPAWFNAGDLGAVDNMDELIRRASSDLEQSDRTAHASGDVACVPSDGATLMWHGSLTYNGTAAVAQVVDDSPRWLMRILAVEDCSLIASQDFAPTTPR
ncbi:MAG: hypothetical protein QOF21_2907 [Actinomycetota bacterium]|jgi:hypothetical protein